MTAWLWIVIGVLTVIVAYQVRLNRRARATEQRLLEQLATVRQRLDDQASEFAGRTMELEALGETLAHDLRNPLNTLGLNLHLMRAALAGGDAERGAMAVEHMERAKDQMVAILDRLRRFTQVCFAELSPEPVDIALLAREVCKELGARASAPPLHCQVGEMPRCVADPQLIRTLLLNLLDTAPIFGDGAVPDGAPRRVEVGHEPGSDPTVYFVREHGTGGKPVAAGPMLESSQRRSGRSFAQAGGVAVAARVASRHGGRLWVTDSSGTAQTTYRFRLAPEQPTAVDGPTGDGAVRSKEA